MKVEVYGTEGTVYTYERRMNDEDCSIIEACGAGRTWILKRMSSRSTEEVQKIRYMLQEGSRRNGCVWPADIVYHNGRPEGLLRLSFGF